MSELKPCPFCQSSDLNMHRALGYFWRCNDCLAEGPIGETQKEADELWNRRASPWRPISEVEPTRNVIIALYDVNSEDRNKAIQAFRDGSKWRVAAFNSADYEEIEPHHFMPLPEPPKEKSE